MRRTTATTVYLKECIGTALLELMREKPFEKINIEEMTARADVGRSTYFRHFKTKDEVLAFKIVCLWERFAADSHVADFLSDPPVAGKMFFEFMLSIRDICELLYSNGRQNAILSAYLTIMAPPKDSADIKRLYDYSYTAYGMFGLVNTWIQRGFTETPAEIEEIIRAGT